MIANIIKTEGQGLFDCRTCILGHIQQGSTPSPLDRIRATRLAVKCVNFLGQHATSNLPSGDERDKLFEENAVVIGISGAHVVFTVCYHMNMRWYKWLEHMQMRIRIAIIIDVNERFI